MNKFEETKELVLKSLESSGAISQLKAQIRTKIFTILDTQSKSIPSSFSIKSPSLQRLESNPQDMLIFQFIIEFLQFYDFEYTLKIITEEANYHRELNREMLAKSQNMDSIDPNKSLLSSIIEAGQLDLRESYPKPSVLANKVEPVKAYSVKKVEHLDEKPMKFNFQVPQSTQPKKNIIPGSQSQNKNAYDFGYPEDPLKKTGLPALNTKSSLPQLSVPKLNQPKKNSPRADFDEYENDFEIEEEIFEDLELSQEKKDKKNISIGLDKSVESEELDNYDYYEKVKKKQLKNQLKIQ